MGGDSRLSARFGSDTSDFKNGIAEINREMRVVESGFRASASALGDWSESATGLENRITALNSQIDLQTEKVDALRAQHERMIEAHGENSVEAQNAEIALNKETEKLNDMKVELGDTTTALGDMQSGSEEAAPAVEEVGNKAEETGTKAKESGNALGGFGDIVGGLVNIAKLTVAAVLGLALALGGVGMAISNLVFSAAETAEGLVDLSTKTGISTQRLQELAFVGDQLGVSQETITGALTRLTRNMGAGITQYKEYTAAIAKAKKEGKPFDGQLGDMAKAFDQLGVKILDSNGKLRDNEAVFADALTALGKIPNEAERDALAMQLFGKSAQELNPLVKAGADEINNLSKEAHDVGAVMSDDAVQGLSDFKDMWDSLTSGIKGVLGSLAIMFLPYFKGLTSQALGFLRTFVALFKSSGGDLKKLGKNIGGMIGALLIAIATYGPMIIEFGKNLINTIVNDVLPNLLNFITWLVTVGVPGFLEFISPIVDKAIPALKTLVDWLVTIAVPAIIAFVTPIIEQAIPILKELATTIINLVAAVLPGLVAGFMWIVQNWGAIQPVLAGIAAGFAAFLIISTIVGWISALTVGIPLAIGAITAIVGAISWPIVAIAALIAALVFLYVAWQNNWMGIRDKTLAFLGDIATGAAAWHNGWTLLWDAITIALAAKFLEMAEGAAAWQNGFTLLWNAVVAAVKSAWKSITDTISGAKTTIDTTIGTIITGIKTAFDIDWGDLGDKIISGIVTALNDGVVAVGGAIASLVLSALKAAKKALGISSPSKLFETEVGYNIVAGMQRGIQNNVRALRNTISNEFVGLTSAMPAATGASSVSNNTSIQGDRNVFFIQGEAAADAVLRQVAANHRRKLNSSMARS